LIEDLSHKDFYSTFSRVNTPCMDVPSDISTRELLELLQTKTLVRATYEVSPQGFRTITGICDRLDYFCDDGNTIRCHGLFIRSLDNTSTAYISPETLKILTYMGEPNKVLYAEPIGDA